MVSCASASSARVIFFRPFKAGDFVEVAWVDAAVAAEAPTVLLVHGLTGSVHSAHVSGLLHRLSALGWRAGCFHFRGCGRVPNRSDKGYHSGMSEDPRAVLQALRQRHSGPLAVVGLTATLPDPEGARHRSPAWASVNWYTSVFPCLKAAAQ